MSIFIKLQFKPEGVETKEHEETRINQFFEVNIIPGFSCALQFSFLQDGTVI